MSLGPALPRSALKIPIYQGTFTSHCVWQKRKAEMYLLGWGTEDIELGCTFSQCLLIVPAQNCNISVTLESDISNRHLVVKISSSSFERTTQQYMS
jgi:hypothetical protein